MATTSEPPVAPVPRPGWRDYATLTKPGITALIVFVAVGGYFAADPSAFDPVRFAVLLATGTSASAGAAMLNHFLDRDLDAKMKRTRHRPLPEARIAPTSSAAVVGLGLLALGVAVASVLLNALTGFSILLGGLTYVVVYTLWLKRRSSWNIVVGGFAGSAPALAGSAAATGTWTHGALAVAVLVFLWTPPHFWSLALLLRDDYSSVGLPMLPRMDDPAYSARIVVVSAALLLPATVLVIVLAPITWPAAVALLAVAAGFLLVTVPLWNRVERPLARRGFVYSGPYLLAVLLALVANWGLLRFGFPGV
ncbi:MAG: heme o synthase [Thermoplasmata archaeon]|nr:heme o synthase [Thermoplasmata archaeon]